jgi:AbrB family looped-hinge helix DNA binding protein
MNLAKVSANGQITVPVEIRRLLEIKEGDKILFSRNENGDIVIGNASKAALLSAQKAFVGVAEEIGNPSEEDIQSWVDDLRYDKPLHTKTVCSGQEGAHT